MALIMGVIHLVLMMGTAAIVFEFYDPSFLISDILGESTTSLFKIFVYGGVLGISLLWALMHAVSGCLMGMAAGGILDGLRLGGALGLVNGVARLWPYILTFGAIGFFVGAPVWHVVAAVLIGLSCLALHVGVKFIWASGSI